MEKSEDNLSYISAVQIQSSPNKKIVGFTFMDTTHKRFFMTEFFDSPNFSLLESALLQVRPSCCAITMPTDSIDLKKISSIFESCDVEIIETSKTYFSDTSLTQDLTRLLNPNDSIRNHLEELRLSHASQALACLIAKWNILSDFSFVGRSNLILHSIDHFLRLDKASFTALLILPRPGESNKRPTSLLGLLNRCKTSIATRKLEVWLSQPLVKFEEISLRHDIVEAFLLDTDLRNSVQATYLRKVPDLDKTLNKFHLLSSGNSPKKSRINLEDIVKLYDCVVESQKLLDYLSGYSGLHCQSIDSFFTIPLRETIEGFQTFLQLVENTIDMKEAQMGNYVISRNFDPKLVSLANEKERVLSDMEKIRSQIEDSLSSEGFSKKSKLSRDEKDSVKIIEDNTLGYVFRVTKKDHSALQGRRDIITVRLNKNEFLFTSHSFRNIVKRYQQCCSEYDSFQSTLVEKTLKIASTYWPVLEKLSDVLSTLDILASFALVASSANSMYVRPILNKEGTLRLLGCRHAIMEAQSDNNEFIPNDIEMLKDKSRLHIITGPNMGGKSTYIRQVALTALMCQIGCFVPCRSANLPIFTQIMCRVGASDIQLKGISTFLAEMVEASTIIKSADENSLVIIDELGRGTSTFEGFGLAWAIARHILIEVKCHCLFATHFHEMGELAEENEGVVNSHVSALVNAANSDRRLTFLYQIHEGPCDQSYGVDVAKMAGVPEEVVAKAQQKSIELESAERLQSMRAQQDQSRIDITMPFKKFKQTLENLFSAPDEASFNNSLSQSIPTLEKLGAIKIND